MCFWRRQLPPDKQVVVDEVEKVLESAYYDILNAFEPFTYGSLYVALKDIQAGHRERLGRPVFEVPDSTVTQLRFAIENLQSVLEQVCERLDSVDITGWLPRKYKKAVRLRESLRHSVKFISMALAGLEPPNPLEDNPPGNHKLNVFCSWYGWAIRGVQEFMGQVDRLLGKPSQPEHLV